ncbi:MAG: hypothetical protein LBJ65_19295 [Burkholderia sp.]|uniref:hypothetical protein n=1 Tax=Burkholderia sp. TaxID=36773 RepID=UPI002834DBDE|nr:hypothetical protein [Burkholderia sp.]MDR0243745.1 hypothetical protein [Burkholderia sp.]
MQQRIVVRCGLRARTAPRVAGPRRAFTARVHVAAPDRIAHAACATSRKFRSRPHIARCHTDVMDIALHSRPAPLAETVF